MNTLHIIHGFSVASMLAIAILIDPFLIIMVIAALFIGWSIGMQFFARFN